ncbi:Cna B-type domain-containing protein, partial [Ligilactobacillus ceti]
ITNTNDSQKISVVIKWDDDQNRDKLRPNQINIQLLANWQVVGEKYAYEGNQWQVDFTKLPIYENGQKIKYTVLEDLVNGYQATLEQKDNNFIIINKHEVALTTIAGKVVWDDQNDVNHIRPTAVNVTLYANGKEVTTIPVTADWKFTFKDLPMNENGKPIVYTIGQNVIKDYTTKIDQNTYTIVNRHLQPTKPVKPKEPTKPVKPKEPTKPVKPVLPKTGMNANDLMAFIGWIFLITAGGFMLLKRKLTN